MPASYLHAFSTHCLILLYYKQNEPPLFQVAYCSDTKLFRKYLYSIITAVERAHGNLMREVFAEGAQMYSAMGVRKRM